ncbi:ATP-binding protein [Zavarzinia sp. CC-PAN008]|uniref:ATP-binding protein n=1 Tax=Zavarzinia sp. CC-PAN008 TaxID=3243332 RepID=UPI003F7444A1
MKLSAVIIENFRGYRENTIIDISDLTAVVGKNDAGKSTILEALEIFFNDGKLDRGDSCVYSLDKIVRIGCVFDDLPEKLTLDSTFETDLKSEYLLNKNGQLQIIKEWNTDNKTPKESIYAVAIHPTAQGISDLLYLKNNELKARLKRMSIDETDVDLTVNAEIRRAIRNSCEEKALAEMQIALEKEDARKIWDHIKPQLPMFALFRSDRASQDADDEVQNPLKFAITQALYEVRDELKRIEQFVQSRAEDVATRTLEKLREMDSALASELKPYFKADPKWDVFRFGLTGDNDIPINKRGSGVRRLVLLNFFRAEAERRRHERGASSVIFAVEEPETSQHPHNQMLLVKALKDLAADNNTQVIITSHTPGLAGLLPSDSLRCVRKDTTGSSKVYLCSETELVDIANDLGVLPDRRVQVLVCVEGPHDIEFLERISQILRKEYDDVVDLKTDHRVALVPLGGGTLKQWVEKRYLRGLSIPEVHIYDRDVSIPPKYKAACDLVNARGDRSWAVLTAKREIENYLHPDAIAEAMDGLSVSFDDFSDVPKIIAEAVHNNSASEVPWSDVIERKLNQKISNAKKHLNKDVVDRMSIRRLEESDKDGEILGWLRRINQMLV